MFYRQDLNTTIGTAATLLAERETVEDGAIRVAPEDIRVVTAATDPVFVFGEAEVPITDEGLQVFGDLLQIPTAFLKRMQGLVPNTTKDLLLNDMLQNSLQKDASVAFGDHGLVSISEWGHKAVKPSDLIGVATSVLGEDASLARWVDTPAFFGFDVFSNEGVNQYGDGVVAYADGNERDDITAGGLRFGVDLKRGLAPFTQEWLYRLACTNGMEMASDGLKVDARGQSVEEVLVELEEMAQIAFGNVERDIMAFYEMRDHAVDNPERALRTIARERGIPDRSTMAILDLATGEDLPDDPSMFDIVNLVTNFANNPKVSRRDGGRLILEAAGGATVAEHRVHSARCSHCKQKVTH